MAGFRVAVVRMAHGERLPILIGPDGLPIYHVTEWLVPNRRPANLAVNTLVANCHALKLLYAWANARDMDIEDRMVRGGLLSADEINNLAISCRKKFGQVSSEIQEVPKVIRLPSPEQVRKGQPKAEALNSAETASKIIVTVSSYLGWLSFKGLQDLDPTAARDRQASVKSVIERLGGAAPKIRGRNIVGLRQAPELPVIDLLLEAIEVGSPTNPWTDRGLQVRNRLLVRMLYGLGIRRGEVLGIKIDDHLDLRKNRVLIARNADDPTDPRLYQPLAKTRDRWLPISDGLAELIEQYVMQTRPSFPKARRHPFLFVSHSDGSPLSLSGFSRIFEKLRLRIPGLPADLTSHSFRHAWNDAFSRRMDEKEIDHVREAQLRSHAMGWSPTSGTASTYTRRKVAEDAEKFSLEHQQTISGRRTGDGGKE